MGREEYPDISIDLGKKLNWRRLGAFYQVLSLQMQSVPFALHVFVGCFDATLL